MVEGGVACLSSAPTCTQLREELNIDAEAVGG